MKRTSANFLKLLTVFLGISTLALMLWFPHIEGRNANATPFEIYFKDPMLAYAYLASLCYFTALYQVYKIWQESMTVKRLRTIKYCVLTLIAFVAVGEIFILLQESDDRVGGFVLGLVIIFGSIAVATLAAKFERQAVGN